MDKVLPIGENRAATGKKNTGGALFKGKVEQGPCLEVQCKVKLSSGNRNAGEKYSMDNDGKIYSLEKPPRFGRLAG